MLSKSNLEVQSMSQTEPRPKKKKRMPKHMMSAMEQLEMEDSEPKVDHRKIVLEMDLIDKSKLEKT